MCWTGKLKDRHTADRDIPVYKIIRRSGAVYTAYYNYFIYAVGKTYNLADEYCQLLPTLHPTIDSRNKDRCRIDIGFHCYSIENTNMTVRLNKGGETHRVAVFANDLTTYLDGYNEYWTNPNHELYLMVCTIPKGAEYYENVYGEIVSESISVKDIISFSNTDRCVDNFAREHKIKIKRAIV